jgi:hypothetical protein
MPGSRFDPAMVAADGAPSASWNPTSGTAPRQRDRAFRYERRVSVSLSAVSSTLPAWQSTWE